MKKKQNRANQTLSGKTYLEMDDETKLQIEALYYCYNLNSHQIGDIVNWPWQSCSKHIKVMNDRIEYGKTTFEKLEAQGEETIAKYSLDLYVNGFPETDDPSLKEEIAVVDPEALAQAFPEIIKPKIEETATDSEISVPPVEDTPKVEEKVSEADESAELDRLFDDLACDNETLETRNETPISRNDQPDSEHDKRVRKDAPFYVALQNIIDRYEAGEITFDGMMLDESRGIFRVDYAIA